MAMSRSFGATLLTTRPPMAISPEEIFSRPAIMRNRVDLPQPEGPTRMTNSPSSISTSTPCRTSVEPNDLRTFRMETLAIILPFCRGGRGRGPLPVMAGAGRPSTLSLCYVGRREWRTCARHKYLEFGDAGFLRGDELQQRRLARLGLLDAALDRRLDLVGIRH